MPRRKNHIAHYKNRIILFLIPLTLYMVTFFVYPVAYDVYISFFDHSLGGPKIFNGGMNYVKMLGDEQFMDSLWRTGLYIVVCVASQLALGIAIALLFNYESKWMNFLRTLILIPTVFTPLVVGLVWKALYHPDMGVITYYLRELGINIGRGPLVERHLALPAIIVIDIWEWTPLLAIIVLAGLKSLPTDPYEAAMLDGANKFQLFRFITIPLLKPTLMVAVLMRTLDVMKTFDIVFATTNGGPGTATTLANLRIYEVGIQQMDIGYAAALSNVLLVFGLALGIYFMNILYARKGAA